MKIKKLLSALTGAVIVLSGLSGMEMDNNIVVQDCPGYNSWSFVQTLGTRLVCVYSRGSAHKIDEPARGVFVRISDDGGKTWSEENVVCNLPDCGNVPIGKGLDQNGNMLLWIRHAGGKHPVYLRHELYESADGIRFRRIAQPVLDPMPVQISDIFHVPGVGLMSLWFAGHYREDPEHSWGTLVSSDNGRTWKQNTIESGLGLKDWPTEPSAVWLGGGKILAIGRCEVRSRGFVPAQFQLESADSGKTWKRSRTNITDVAASTPSLILDPSDGTVSQYYYQRYAGLLKCRTVSAESIWNNPLGWPEPRVVAAGSREAHHAGNVNAAAYRDRHCVTFYSGDPNHTAVLVKLIRPVQRDGKDKQ